MSVLCTLWDILSGLSVMTWLVVILILLVSYDYVIKEPWKNLPPGPPALPIVGSLPFVGSDLGKAAIQLSKRYGNIMTVYLGSRRVVVLNGYAMIKEALSKKVFSGRPSIFLMKELLQGRGIVAGQGKSWYEVRRHSSRILRDFGIGKTSFEDKILEEIHYFLDVLRCTGSSPFFPHPLLQKSVSNVICSVTFGRRFDYNDPLFKRNIQNITDTVDKVGNSSVLTIFPILKYLPGDLFHRNRLVKIQELARGQYQCYVEEHKRKLTNDSEPADFIDAFLQAVNKQNSTDSALTEKELLHVIADLFTGGSETTSTTLSWTVVHLVRNPEIQDKIHREIDDVIRNGEVPRMQHKHMLPLTESFIFEVQRCSDIVPLGLPHATTEDVHFNGYFIPMDTMIIPNMNSINFDPDVWPNPHLFDPTRFLHHDGKIVRKEQLLPFSTGKRICPGESLARMELFLYFVSMMQHFRFRSAPGYPVPSDKGIMGITYSPREFHLVVEERKNKGC